MSEKDCLGSTSRLVEVDQEHSLLKNYSAAKNYLLNIDARERESFIQDMQFQTLMIV